MRLILVIIFHIFFCVVSLARDFGEMVDSLFSEVELAKFVGKKYDWFERVFDNYDTVYVAPVEERFKVKLTSSNEINFIRQNFKNGGHMNIQTSLISNLGIGLSYRFFSLGYQMNLDKYKNGYKNKNKKYNINLHAAVGYLKFFLENNDQTAMITNFKTQEIYYREKIKFNGFKTFRWGLQGYYFINNKKYSQSAAFEYSRYQLKSQGSFYFGIAYLKQKYRINFSTIPAKIIDNLPYKFENDTYKATSDDFFLIGGYAFNWVVDKHWLVAFTESPEIGYRTGHINFFDQNRINISNQFRLGIVYNCKKFFVGLQSSLYTSLTKDPHIAMWENDFTTELNIGYRFNL